jgi:hypothetical protein
MMLEIKPRPSHMPGKYSGSKGVGKERELHPQSHAVYSKLLHYGTVYYAAYCCK